MGKSQTRPLEVRCDLPVALYTKIINKIAVLINLVASKCALLMFLDVQVFGFLKFLYSTDTQRILY